jgi:hypothetical protein
MSSSLLDSFQRFNAQAQEINEEIHNFGRDDAPRSRTPEPVSAPSPPASAPSPPAHSPPRRSPRPVHAPAPPTQVRMPRAGPTRDAKSAFQEPSPDLLLKPAEPGVSIFTVLTVGGVIVMVVAGVVLWKRFKAWRRRKGGQDKPKEEEPRQPRIPNLAMRSTASEDEGARPRGIDLRIERAMAPGNIKKT